MEKGAFTFGIDLQEERIELAKDMTKEEAIAKIKLLDKKQLYDAIDSIPDNVIAGLFKDYLAKKIN